MSSLDITLIPRRIDLANKSSSVMTDSDDATTEAAPSEPDKKMSIARSNSVNGKCR